MMRRAALAVVLFLTAPLSLLAGGAHYSPPRQDHFFDHCCGVRRPPHHPPIQFIYYPENSFDNLDQDRRAGKLNTELSKLGLEPTKEAYEAKLSSLRVAEKQNQAAGQSPLSRFLFGARAKGPGMPGVPLGYLEGCDRRGNCYVHWKSVNF